jgi:hypothetical protein
MPDLVRPYVHPHRRWFARPPCDQLADRQQSSRRQGADAFKGYISMRVEQRREGLLMRLGASSTSAKFT